MGFGRMCLRLPAMGGRVSECVWLWEKREGERGTDFDEDETGSICFYLGPVDVRLVARYIATFRLCSLFESRW